MNEYICEYTYEGQACKVYLEASSYADADARIRSICQTGTITAKVESKLNADADLIRKIFPITSKRKT